MAKCYNCGTEIPADDKLRLCDRCKSVLLPFIKFTDASTSSAVRRLIANERNLRARGVTDNGSARLTIRPRSRNRHGAMRKERPKHRLSPSPHLSPPPGKKNIWKSTCPLRRRWIFTGNPTEVLWDLCRFCSFSAGSPFSAGRYISSSPPRSSPFRASLPLWDPLPSVHCVRR